MSRENVEIVRRVYEAFNRRDEDSLLRLYDAEAEVHSFAALVEGSNVFQGHQGVLDWHRNLVETLGMIIEPGEFFTHSRFVLAMPAIHVTLGEGPAGTYGQGIVYEIRAGRVLRSFGYEQVGDAMVTLGRLLLGEENLIE